MANTPQETIASTAPRELSVGEQQELIKEEIARFMKLAREKGFLTIEEINDL